MLPWLTKSHDVSGEARDERGRWTGGSSIHDRIDEHREKHRYQIPTATNADLKAEHDSAESILSDVRKMPVSELKKIAKHMDIVVGSSDSKSALLQRIENRLKSLHHAASRSEGALDRIKAKGLPWLVVKVGRFEEGKHPRDHGRFSSKPGASGTAARNGTHGGKPIDRTNPDLDALFAEKPAAPQQPARDPRKNTALEEFMGMGSPATKPKAQPPDLPHHRTQATALESATALRANPSPEAHKQAVANLNAHYVEGLKAIDRMAVERYGNTPRARQVAEKSKAALKAKLMGVRQKLDSLGKSPANPPPLPAKMPRSVPAHQLDRLRHDPNDSPELARAKFETLHRTLWGEHTRRTRKRKGYEPFDLSVSLVPFWLVMKGKSDAGRWEHGSHRSQLRQGHQYEIAKHRKAARKAGHDPKHLDSLASEIRAHHDAFADERKAVLQYARDHAAKNKFGSLREIKRNQGAKGDDYTKIKGFDLVTESTRNAFPHHFHDEDGEHGSHEDQLFEMLTGEEPKRMRVVDAYSQALDVMGERQPNKASTSEDDDKGYPDFWDEPIEPTSHNYDELHAKARLLANGGGLSADEGKSLAKAYDELTDEHKSKFAKAIGIKGVDKALPETRDELVHRAIRERVAVGEEFDRGGGARDLAPGGKLFDENEVGIGKTRNLFG